MHRRWWTAHSGADSSGRREWRWAAMAALPIAACCTSKKTGAQLHDRMCTHDTTGTQSELQAASLEFEVEDKQANMAIIARRGQ